LSGLRQERQQPAELDASGWRCAIVAARYHDDLVIRLVEGARECLAQHGVAEADVELLRVPGAWELPLALQRLASMGGLDVMVALGVVVRGETPHFDYVCRESSAGIARVSLDHGVPIGFGVLTCEDTEQAAARSGGKAGNKGWEAAMAALEMAQLLRRIGSP
jgi:6,7-dimethyl-8-ribityllumazine synthase